MNLQLKRLRKQAGYKTQGDFASVAGIPERRYASWEREEVMMSLEQAYNVTEILGCSLEELVGRDKYSKKEFPDERQRDLNSNFEELTDEGKDAALGSVRGIRASESARAKTEGPATGNQKVG